MKFPYYFDEHFENVFLQFFLLFYFFLFSDLNQNDMENVLLLGLQKKNVFSLILHAFLCAAVGEHNNTTKKTRKNIASEAERKSLLKLLLIIHTSTSF